MSRRWTAQELAEVQCRMVNSCGEMGPATSISVPVTHAAKPTKYRSKAVRIDGKSFASKLEGRCYEGLKLREKAGDIRWFIRQPRFELEGGVVYVADFLAETYKGPEVIDATGKLTRVKANKLKQVKARFGIDVTLWTDKPA